MNEKFLSLLGMARRAGKLSLGHDAAKGSLVSGKAKMCILSCDTSERLQNEFKNLSNTQGKDIPIFTVECTMFELGHAVGSKAGVITVDDEGFAEGLKRHLRNGNTV